MRGASFSFGSYEYGEICYGRENSFDAINYAKERLNISKKQYTAYTNIEDSITDEGDMLVINNKISTKIGTYNTTTKCIKINPVNRIRENRY